MNNPIITTSPEDIARLKAAYRNHQQTVTLTDGRTITRRPARTCYGCVFASAIKCYCEDGEKWVDEEGLLESK